MKKIFLLTFIFTSFTLSNTCLVVTNNPKTGKKFYQCQESIKGTNNNLITYCDSQKGVKINGSKIEAHYFTNHVCAQKVEGFISSCEYPQRNIRDFQSRQLLFISIKEELKSNKESCPGKFEELASTVKKQKQEENNTRTSSCMDTMKYPRSDIYYKRTCFSYHLSEDTQKVCKRKIAMQSALNKVTIESGDCPNSFAAVCKADSKKTYHYSDYYKHGSNFESIEKSLELAKDLCENVYGGKWDWK